MPAKSGPVLFFLAKKCRCQNIILSQTFFKFDRDPGVSLVHFVELFNPHEVGIKKFCIDH